MSRILGTVSQAAAFSLFEQLRHLKGLPLAPASDARISFESVVEPTACRLAFTALEEATLQLTLLAHAEAKPRPMWVHATWDERGPVLSAYVRRERPALTARFGLPAFVPAGDNHFVLRERPTFPSGDANHAMRVGMAARLAQVWEVPTTGTWLDLGAWDAGERAWEADAARRFLATALLIETARSAELDPR